MSGTRSRFNIAFSTSDSRARPPFCARLSRDHVPRRAEGVRARRPIFDISLSDGNWHRNFSRVVGAGLSSLPSPTVRCKLAACLPLDRRALATLEVSAVIAYQCAVPTALAVHASGELEADCSVCRQPISSDAVSAACVRSTGSCNRCRLPLQRRQSVARLHRSSDAHGHIRSGRGRADVQGGPVAPAAAGMASPECMVYVACCRMRVACCRMRVACCILQDAC